MRAGLYLGFPGIGKTPMAKEEPNVLDLDAGHVRQALAEVAGIPESEIDQKELAHFVAVLAEKYISEGWAVITNLPDVMDFHRVHRVYVQAPHAYRSMDGAAKKLGVDRATVQTYIEDWIMAARTHEVSVVRLRKGLDYIFRQTRAKNQRLATTEKSEDYESLTCSDEPGNKEPKMGEFW